MPYKNIVWIKLEVRLLNDPRWFTMSDKARLLYVELLLTLGQNGGKVTRSWSVLADLLRLKWTEVEYEQAFDEIQKNFPKVIVNNGFIKVRDFDKRHNRVPESGASQNVPEGHTREDKIKIRVDRETLNRLLICFLKTKNIPLNDGYVSLIVRYGKALKELYLLANSSVEDAEGAIAWAGREWNGKGFDWGVEAVVRNYHGYLTSKNKAQPQQMSLADTMKLAEEKRRQREVAQG